jgi:hypothetical protein
MKHKTVITCRKWDAHGNFLGEVVVEDNVLLNEGIQKAWDLIIGASTTGQFNSTNSHIGVGDGTTAESPSQTGLTGTSKFYKQVDAGYPVRSGNTVTWLATFAGTEANFAWNEVTVANGNSDAAVNLNRKAVTLGTKASGAVWQLRIDITMS